jgi:hypothetical protein
MLIEDKNLWLEALRSGKYKQTVGFLKVQREGERFYCCLGVLCEILKDKYEIRESTSAIEPGVTYFNNSSDRLPNTLTRALKLEIDTVSTLYRMNDDDKRSFAAIADWIEVHVPASPEATAETTNA